MADNGAPHQPISATPPSAAPAPASALVAPSATAAPPETVTPQHSSISEGTRTRVLFGIFVALIVLYPLIDRALGFGRMGSMNSILIFTLLALGLNIVVGFAGLLDLGYAAFFAIGGYTVAFLTAPQSPLVQYGIVLNSSWLGMDGPLVVVPPGTEVDFWIALPIAFVVAAIFGVILGAPTLRLRGDYLAIVTLAFGEIVPQSIRNLEAITNGTKGMNPIGRPHFTGTELLASDQVPWYYLILAVSALSVFVILRMRDSRLGRAWMAMREDEIAASSMGINLVRTKLLAFSLGASFSGFGGALYASMLQYIGPDQFDFSISIILLAMIILGGIGNIWGVIFGGIVLGTFNFILVDSLGNWLKATAQWLRVPPPTQLELLGNPPLYVLSAVLYLDVTNAKLFIFGLSLVLLMLIRPEGIFPSAQRRAELGRARPRRVLAPKRAT